MFRCKALILSAFLIQQSSQFSFDIANTIDDVLDVLVPTTHSSNPKCRNHSELYVQELKKLRLWATEMFDASSKFPGGVLFGSTYDLGNFDECIEVRVPLEENETLSGRYCMAKFHITPPDSIENNRKFLYGFYENDNFINVSTWEKISAFSKDRSRGSRSDFYFSYCIPSSCQPEDLESSLQNVVEVVNTISDFKVSVSVDERHCQTKTDLTLNAAEISFLTVVGAFVLIALMATIYDWLMKLDDLQKFKLTGNKHRVLMAFSIWTNLKKLNSKSQNEGHLQCIHGFKVISMFLIIMGHRIMFGIGSPILNSNFVEHFYGRVETTVLLNGPIIVDTFFNISGFLACYLMLTELAKRKTGVNFFYLYIHRLIRLTPAYAVVLAFYCTIFIKTGSGPFWLERVQVEQERCMASWWTNLLYLNNYINKDQICMFQSWYMTCDMHFFIAAPIFVWLLRKKPTIGLVALLTIIILSVSVVFAIVYMNNEEGILLLYMKFLRDPVVHNTFKNVYIPTHMRASPYFVGMITGYLKYKMRLNNYKMPKYMVYMGWIMCILIIEVTVYSAFIFYIPGQPYDPIISATYASMHHFTWSICISWMIIAISEGGGAWIEPIVSWKPLTLLSRITYSAFLCHGAIQIYTAAVLRQPNYASVFNLIYQSAADITLAYICGLVLSMFFEAPILALEKVLLKNQMKGDKAEKPTLTVVIPKIKTIS